MGTPIQTPAKPSRGRRNLLAAYDQNNDMASAIILGDPEKHSDFQISWAQKYTARRAQEGREAVSR